jgi:signal transduction histidine kinase
VVSVYRDARVTVADRGSGVLPQDHERIFERFWRGKGERGEGAGLALSIVREIMNAHQGWVSVEANPNGGTIFTLQFAALAGKESATQIHSEVIT